MSETGGLSNVAVAIVGAMSKWERKPADFYPTPPDVTYALVPHIRDILPDGAHIWEPACGDGAMARALEDCGYRVTSTDLREDSGYGEGGVDFLNCERSIQCDAIITNPPFNVAEDFIRKSLERAPIVAMLLKSQYWHAARRKRLFDQHTPSKILPLTWRPSFLEKERGNSPLMDVLWTVWERDYEGSTAYYPIGKSAPPTPDFEALFS